MFQTIASVGFAKFSNQWTIHHKRCHFHYFSILQDSKLVCSINSIYSSLLIEVKNCLDLLKILLGTQQNFAASQFFLYIRIRIVLNKDRCICWKKWLIFYWYTVFILNLLCCTLLGHSHNSWHLRMISIVFCLSLCKWLIRRWY